VRRTEDDVEVTPRNGEPLRFDHVVIACHADQALRMLADPTPVERELLGAFPYERNTAVLHTDVSLLPRRRRAWASWNYRLPAEPTSRATVTYCMNMLQGLRSKHVFNVTLNSDDRIDPAKVLGRFVYEHPVFTTARAAAQARHGEVIGRHHTSFCGAYWRNGFHEDGVVSALAVCRELNRLVELPGTRHLETVA
jgi:predicted NAD/FAD-binding protein